MKKLVSIILRAKNEEFWIGRFMQELKKQKSPYDVEIILVDNCSSDHTIEKALSLYDKIKVVTVEKYIPGAALNRGLDSSKGEYVICISAHCIPVNSTWLVELIKPLEDLEIAAVYGRQIPLITSDPKDKRDLWLTFGMDDKVQSRDPFLHNANSAYRREDLLKHPFSETMTNIEDRSWAQSEINLKRKIYYTSSAIVYHDHGIHQSGCQKRLEGVIGMMDELHNNYNQFEHYYGKKDAYIPPSCCLIIPISSRYGDEDINELINHAKDIKDRFSDWTVYVMPTLSSHADLALELGFKVLDFRLNSSEVGFIPLVSDISKAVKNLTNRMEFYDYIGTFDIRKWIPSQEFLMRTLSLIQTENADTAIGAVHKPKPTFVSTTGEAFHMEQTGWLNWIDEYETTMVPVLDPSAFILAKMDVFRTGNPIKSKYCPVELI